MKYASDVADMIAHAVLTFVFGAVVRTVVAIALDLMGVL